MRKIIAIAGLIVCVGTAVAVYSLRKADVNHYPERRAWKNVAIRAIEDDLRRLPTIGEKDEESITPEGDSEWMTKERILCGDGEWLAYRQQCHKQEPKMHDIFIARASDGKWYYSDFHFCVGAMVLAADGQPESLEQFKKSYHLVEFDGSSDDALNPTWKP